MKLIQVDVVSLHSLQAGVQRSGQVFSVEVGFAVADMAGALGVAHGTGRLAGQDDVVAAFGFGKPASDISFCQALCFGFGGDRIHFGGVDQVHALGQSVVQLLVRLGFAVLFAPGHGAQADQADVDIGTAKFAVFQMRGSEWVACRQEAFVAEVFDLTTLVWIWLACQARARKSSSDLADAECTRLYNRLMEIIDLG